MDQSQAHFRQQIHTPSFTFNPNSVNNKFRRDTPARSIPTSTMNPNDLSKPADTTGGGLGMWSSPPQPVTGPSQARSRPSTIHETGFSYCMPEEYTSLPAWDSSTMPMHGHGHEGFGQSYHHEYYASSGIEHNEWPTKSYDDGLDMHNNDTEMHMGQAYTTDEAIPILDLRYQNHGVDSDPLSLENTYNSRRLSGSSFTMSTNGALSEMQSYEDFSASLSEAPSFSSEYPPPSNRNSLMSSTQLSPVASPRMTPHNRSELVRTQSRGRASPSPRPSMRSAPYSIDSARNKRWSTGSYAPLPSRRPSPFVYNHGPETFTPLPQRMSSRHSSPTVASIQGGQGLPLNMSNLQTQQLQHPFMMSSQPQNVNPQMNRHSMLLPSSQGSHGYQVQEPYPVQQLPHFQHAPAPLLSHGLFRMLQSNADPNALHNHYTDASDPPDLYASLNSPPLSPPPEDMEPTSPSLTPHEQELRFSGDLYTPKYVRGHGNKREGWCGICKPGRWLVLKNSAFWYDKSFTHGISAATGSAFSEPVEVRRMDGGGGDVWEGLCGSCGEWVALVSSKKKGTTWFRHAYKCHTHPKIKDAPKRRRESSHTRAVAANPNEGVSNKRHSMGSVSTKTRDEKDEELHLACDNDKCDSNTNSRHNSNSNNGDSQSNSSTTPRPFKAETIKRESIQAEKVPLPMTPNMTPAEMMTPMSMSYTPTPGGITSASRPTSGAFSYDGEFVGHSAFTTNFSRPSTGFSNGNLNNHGFQFGFNNTNVDATYRGMTSMGNIIGSRPSSGMGSRPSSRLGSSGSGGPNGGSRPSSMHGFGGRSRKMGMFGIGGEDIPPMPTLTPGVISIEGLGEMI